MKISFQTPEGVDINRTQTGKQAAVRKPENTGSATYGAYFQSGADREGLIARGGAKGKGKTLTELQQEAANMDVGIMQDYRTVLSNTLSAEDYAELEKEGFDLGNLDPEETVTIVDKIKAEMARSGKQIAGYNDDLDMETLAEAVGSATLAQVITQSFEGRDLPLSEENIAGVRQAWEMTAQLTNVSEGSISYMLENEMEPEIWNFYLAQSSGSLEQAGRPRFYAEDIDGYYVENAVGEPVENLNGQIDRILQSEGIEVNEENREAAERLLKDQIPIDDTNLERMKRLSQVKFPVEEEIFAQAVAVAVVEGRRPVFADLTRTETLYEKAGRVLEQYRDDGFARELAQSFFDDEQAGIAARKQLEEIRLRMTAEVNVKLLKSGFVLDTAPMEQLIEALQKAEEAVASEYFPADEQAIEKYRLFGETNRVVEEIPTLPADILGAPVWGTGESLAQFYNKGVALKQTYQRAETSYETLMTVPRKDLGDSIRKAFANVDDILKDLSLEPTEENRKSVRILGYNRMEVTTDNITRVSEAMTGVERVVEKMTPAAVLKMIRDGENPLEKSFDQLEIYFDSLPEEYTGQAQSYSRFLYKLERQHDITAEERESFIGIYRLLHQMDATDGAAVGALVNTNAELHFSNLLSAVRSGRFKGVDARISDSFGGRMDVIRSGESISDQIAKAFVKDTETLLQQALNREENEKAYREWELEHFREAARVEQEAVDLLERAGLTRNADHLLAAQSLIDGENLFKRLEEKRQRAFKPGEPTERMADGLLEQLEDKDSFRSEYEKMTETLKEEVAELTLQQADTSVDVTSLQMMHKQLSVMRSLSAAEEYRIPLNLDGELIQVHLTFLQGQETRSNVRISTQVGEDSLEAALELLDGRLGGLLIGNNENAVTRLQNIADIFYDSLHNSDIVRATEPLPVVLRGTGKAAETRGGEQKNIEQTAENATNVELYQVAKLFLQAVKMAVSER